MQTIITADEVRRVIEEAETAEDALSAAIYGDMNARRRVNEIKMALEYEYANDKDQEKIVELTQKLAQAEADKNSKSGRKESSSIVDKLSESKNLARIRANAYRDAYLTQCMAVIENAIMNDKSWVGLHCHYKRTIDKMQKIIDEATKDLDGIRAYYSGSKRQYYRESPARYDATVTVRWKHEYSHIITMNLINYSKDSMLSDEIKYPVSERRLANITAHQIDQEVYDLARAKRDISEIKSNYYTQCASIIERFSILSTEDLEKMASVSEYSIRNTSKNAA